VFCSPLCKVRAWRQEAVSVAAWTLTATWQLARLPKAPQYGEFPGPPPPTSGRIWAPTHRRSPEPSVRSAAACAQRGAVGRPCPRHAPQSGEPRSEAVRNTPHDHRGVMTFKQVRDRALIQAPSHPELRARVRSSSPCEPQVGGPDFASGHVPAAVPDRSWTGRPSSGRGPVPVVVGRRVAGGLARVRWGPRPVSGLFPGP